MECRRRPGRSDAPDMTKAVRRREKPRERWLLTRKTWKYMSDAGRRLIPDGAQNRPEDVPRIEAYFQEVCAKEPRFLLWRKSSYPGALPRPRRKKRPRGGSVRARSPSDDTPLLPARPTDLCIPHISGGRFDIAKLRRDFFAAPPTASSSGASGSGFRAGPTSKFRVGGNTSLIDVNSGTAAPTEEDDESSLVDLLRKYLKLEENTGVSKLSDSEELVRVLRKYLKRQADNLPTDGDTDPSQRSLLENLGRYYGRSPNRDHIVQDLLTDRNLLKRLYHDLRKTKPYRGGRSSGSGGYGPCVLPSTSNSSRNLLRNRNGGLSRRFDGEDSFRSPPMSPPPLIEVFGESLEDKMVDCGTQTLPIPEDLLLELEKAYRDRIEAATAPTSPTSPPPERKPGRRRSSVDHDDVSQSVSDTIKRYLRMARKKSVDADKADQFKRINYDKNLRNIKPRMPGEVDDDGPHKGCQTEEGWILTYRDLRFASVASTPTSPPSPVSPSAPHSFLSTLLGRSAPAVAPAGGMQKSRSSSSVVQSVSKRLWRTRSRSSSRASTTWTPQGSCLWADGSGRCVRLTDTSLLALSEVERRALQQAALARLQQMNLGIAVKLPEENAVAPSTKPKRRAYLLKRKALTTGFFDQSRAKDDKEKETGAGSVFGVPLAQCVETERALRRQQHGGSRASLASLGATDKGDDSESCDSSDWWAGLDEAGGGGPRVPGLVSACLAHLRQHGLHTLGLFRVSASKKRVRQLREDWERGQETALDAAVCPHDVATLLKEFLRDLPDPLLCRDLYTTFLSTQKVRSRRLQWEALRLAVALLPAAHRDTLHALLSFLAALAAHAHAGVADPRAPANKMDAANLATIFAPNILHRNKPNEPASTEQLSERADVINVVRVLVERQNELWTLPADLLHDAYVRLARTEPQRLDVLLQRRAECQEAGVGAGAGRVWPREACTHLAAATGGDQGYSEKIYTRRRTRDTASDTSSGSMSSTITTVVTSSSRAVCSESGLGHTAADSNDSASDYNETLGGSDEDSCVITASLHIPAPAAAAARRRSSGSESSKRDSAVGSSPASSPLQSPTTSPAPTTTVSASEPLRVTLAAAAEIRRTPDIDRLISLGRERNTSDARAVILRQHDETTSRSSKVSSRQEHVTGREDLVKRDDQSQRRDETPRREGTLYKRGELISSARTPPT